VYYSAPIKNDAFRKISERLELKKGENIMSIDGDRYELLTGNVCAEEEEGIGSIGDRIKKDTRGQRAVLRADVKSDGF
jgi:hypothetical protein